MFGNHRDIALLLGKPFSGDGEDRRRETAARTGLALTILKHSLPGDASLFGQRDIDQFVEGGADVRR